MTRVKVISIAFLAGLVVGCAVPAAKAVTIAEHNIAEGTVTKVDGQACSVSVDNEPYSVDCESVDLFSQGDSVAVGFEDDYTFLITSKGEQVEVL
ncbi:TPA: hypothetical protein JLG68_001378 [Escherichia coli]|nr:hypothetical protein [Escherichia coli]